MSFVKSSKTKIASIISNKKVKRIIAYILVVFFIIILIYPMPWLTKTSRIGTFDSGPGVSISPNRDKMFIFQSFENGDRNVILYDTNTKKRSILNSYKVKENINSEFIGWYDNERYMIKEAEEGLTKYLLTKDFSKYDVLYTLPDGLYEELSSDGKKLVMLRSYVELSPDGKKLIIQDDKDKKLILYEDGKEVWSTNQYYDRYLISWSDDGRYAILTEKIREKDISSAGSQLITEIKTPDVDGLFLFDTVNKTIVKMSDYSGESIGIWAPNKGVFIDSTNDGYDLYDVEKQRREKLELNDINPYLVEDLLWSPDERYIAVIAMDAIYTYDTLAEQNPLKLLFKVNENTSIDKYKIRWAEDSKHILFTISQTTLNWLKPEDYYVAKVDINSGKIKKRFIKASLNDDLFRWLNENEVIYTLDENKLYRTKLIW